MSPTFTSLQYFNYRLWFAGALVANVGTWMQRVAQDWLVLTQLTSDSGVAVGTACDGCPPLPELLDRYERAGGRYLVCPICVNSKKIDSGTLIAGAEMSVVAVDRRRRHDLQLLRPRMRHTSGVSARR